MRGANFDFGQCGCVLPKKNGYKVWFLEPQDHARMKDLKIPVLMVALKSLYEFPDPFRAICMFFLVCLFKFVLHSFEKERLYEAPFLEAQDHARMKDLKIPVLTVALRPLYDSSQTILCQHQFFSSLFFIVFETRL